jgi:short-subunit dehydrogenase
LTNVSVVTGGASGIGRALVSQLARRGDAVVIADRDGDAAAYRAMVERGSGRIVNIASGAGLVPAGLRVPYTTAKHGVVGLSTSLCMEAARYGVGVNVVCPGVVDTNIFNTAPVVGAPRSVVSEGLRGTRMMSPDRAAELILRGIEHDRAIIVLTARMHALWWLYRLSPALAGKMIAKNMQQWRRRIAHARATEP